jgi:bifunctional oligoribonuclease and PAP phosphatase NrnA
MTKNDMQDAVRVFQEAKSFLVLGHVNPDGDALGSMCALRLAAESLQKSILMVIPDDYSESYKFLEGTRFIAREIPAGSRFDVGVILDCDGPARLGSMQDALSQCGTTLEFDHHPGSIRVSDVRVIDPQSASTGEIVYEFLIAAGIKMSAEIAECLLTAIITDTGCFRFSNVKPSTLRIASDLVECGVSINSIVHKVYETRTLGAARILGAALASLRTSQDGQVAYTTITREQILSAGADEAETDGVVNYVRSVRGARIGIFFREGEDGTTRVSLRSTDGSDISQVARIFGGGGHRTAAGCIVEHPINEAADLVLSAVQKWMAS